LNPAEVTFLFFNSLYFENKKLFFINFWAHFFYEMC